MACCYAMLLPVMQCGMSHVGAAIVVFFVFCYVLFVHWFRVLLFRMRCGLSVALAAGFCHAEGFCQAVAESECRGLLNFLISRFAVCRSSNSSL